MALYLDQHVKSGCGTERENAIVRRRFPFLNGSFGGAWTLDEAISVARTDVFSDRLDRPICLRILVSADEP